MHIFQILKTVRVRSFQIKDVIVEIKVISKELKAISSNGEVVNRSGHNQRLKNILFPCQLNSMDLVLEKRKKKL
jgi:hypothetical protein